MPTTSPASDPWPMFAAAVEAAEPGASSHCVLCIRDNDGAIVGYEHVRLGIRVTVTR